MNIQEVGVSRWRTTADRSPCHQLDEISVDNDGETKNGSDDLARSCHNLVIYAFGAPPIPVHRTFAYDALDRMTKETLTIGSDMFTTSSVWTGSATDFWRREVTYPSGKVVGRQMDGAGRLASVGVDGRNIDFLWTGDIYTGRVHDWASSAMPDPLRHTVTLDGLGRGIDLEFDLLARDARVGKTKNGSDGLARSCHNLVIYALRCRETTRHSRWQMGCRGSKVPIGSCRDV